MKNEVRGLRTRRRRALLFIPEQPLFDGFLEVFGEGEEGEAERDGEGYQPQRFTPGVYKPYTLKLPMRNLPRLRGYRHNSLCYNKLYSHQPRE